jgi:hypothetical protein
MLDSLAKVISDFRESQLENMYNKSGGVGFLTLFQVFTPEGAGFLGLFPSFWGLWL